MRRIRVRRLCHIVAQSWLRVMRRMHVPILARDEVHIVDETGLVVRIAALGGSLQRAIADGSVARAETVLDELRGLLRSVAQTQSSDGREHVSRPAPMKFFFDAKFLAESCRYVCGAGKSAPGSTGDEVFHYCAGFELAPRTFVVTQFLPVQFSQQSATRVRVENGSNIASLEMLDHWGLPLVCHCHSHPSHGVSATHPSGIDRAFQERLERGGHVAIGAIFSRDGFVRFFAGSGRRFDVEVRGKHVREVGKHVFKIEVENGKLPVADSRFVDR